MQISESLLYVIGLRAGAAVVWDSSMCALGWQGWTPQGGEAHQLARRMVLLEWAHGAGAVQDFDPLTGHPNQACSMMAHCWPDAVAAEPEMEYHAVPFPAGQTWLMDARWVVLGREHRLQSAGCWGLGADRP